MKANLKTIGAAFAAVFCAAVVTYLFVDDMTEPPALRAPASIPGDYETLGACEKQDLLWERITESIHQQLPPNREFGALQLMAMTKQHLSHKGNHVSDFAPDGWKKYIHGRGVVAKVKIVPAQAHAYTGLFQGADCGLLRLSLTYRVTKSRPVAPGLALKVLRDGAPSANVSALVSLDGQGRDFNFFKYPMSNIVPIGKDFGQKAVSFVFGRYSRFPEELLVDDFAAVDARGAKIAGAAAPRQLFFVPNPSLNFASNVEHDPREDILRIPAGTLLYKVYAVPEKRRSFDYAQYGPGEVSAFLKESLPIADIVTTSEFLASSFGDDGLFFRHQLRE